MIERKIRETEAGGRLDKYLFRFMDKAPKSFVYKMLRKKNIVLNDHRASGNELLKAGDCVKLYLADDTIAGFRSEQKEEKAPDSNAFLKGFGYASFQDLILFEDKNILAANKPAGMLSQKAESKDISLNELIRFYLRSSSLEDDDFVPGISNRLDRNTSGIVLAAKNAASARELNDAIRQRRITKKYLALVKGRVDKPQHLEGYLIKDHQTNKVQIIPSSAKSAEQKGAYAIKTNYQPLSYTARSSLLEIDLITGRSHQIRAHLASVGHPVAGDPKYGDASLNRFFRENYGLNSQFLHAFRIEFADMKGILTYLNGTTITAPLSKKMDAALKGEQLWLHGGAED